MGEWRGSRTNCVLDRYGLQARVERLGISRWWFTISRHGQCVHNMANAENPVRLKSSRSARIAAETCVELINKKGLG